ncbi:acetate--CoA ligase family protein [Peribacillus sp. NPDC097225]|uniref:acetate--CoA ligase family protein n=1 Tax=Peribacillus sp. NPDC097225 TaxID=3364400 RepID=UPI0038041C77
MTLTEQMVEEKTFLTEYEGAKLLKKFKLPVAPAELAKTREEAVIFADKIGYPLVLKGMSPQITHKTEAGIVKVNIQDEQQLLEAYEAITNNAIAYDASAKLEGVLIQKMSQKGLELILGIKRDPVFGHLLVLGMGGTFVEILKDFSMRIMPVSKQDVLSMVDELKSAELVKGYRDQAGIDMSLLVDICQKLNELVTLHPEIMELDLNPVIFSAEGPLICDVRILNEPVIELEGERRSLENLDKLLHPSSIAIVGASSNEKKNGGRLVKYLVENQFKGKVFPINPKADEIFGHRVYPSLTHVTEPIDVACIIVAAQSVPGVMRECQQKGIKNVIIYSSGFAETGAKGALLQQEILSIAKEAGIRIVGPNVIGVASPNDNVYMAFGSALTTKEKVAGGIGFISQSGAMGSALLSRAWENKVGFSRWVTVANEVDLTTSDFIETFAEDSQTKVISAFMEGLKDAKAFERATQKALDAKKPVLVYKTGRSEVGKRAVQSHTGSIAGDEAVYSAAFRKYNVLPVEQIEDLIEVAAIFEKQPLPKGNRIGIVTASGGACSVIADLCTANGLEVPELTETAEKIKQYIPVFGAANNPVDVTAEIIGNPDMFKKVLTAVVEDSQIDGVLVMLTSNADPGALVIAEAIYEVFQSHQKPIIVGRLGATAIAPKAVSFYQEKQFFVYPNPEKIVKAMKYLVDYERILRMNGSL